MAQAAVSDSEQHRTRRLTSGRGQIQRRSRRLACAGTVPANNKQAKGLIGDGIYPREPGVRERSDRGRLDDPEADGPGVDDGGPDDAERAGCSIRWTCCPGRRTATRIQSQIEPNDYVERSRRMHRNDLENIPAFLACGMIFVAVEPPLVLANILFFALCARPLRPHGSLCHGPAARSARDAVFDRLRGRHHHGRVRAGRRPRRRLAVASPEGEGCRNAGAATGPGRH